MKIGDRIETRFGNGIIVGEDFLPHDAGQWWYVRLDFQDIFEKPYLFTEQEIKKVEAKQCT